MIETRAASLEIRGRHIAGLALPWGERAVVPHRGKVVQETFVAGAFTDLKAIPLYLEHRGPVIGEVVPTSTERGIEVAGDYAGDLGGRDRFSIEFKTRAETMSRGLRIVSGATLHGLAALARPAYDGAVIETRRRLGPSLRASIPFGKRLDCKCGFGCDEILFEADAFEDVTTALATVGRMDQVIGNAVLTPGRRGLGIEVDLLDTESARDLVALVGGGVSIYARPLLDLEKSDTKESRRAGGTLVVTKASFTTLLVKPVAGGVAGLNPVSLADDSENRGGLVRVEPSSALEPIPGGFRRNRIWL